MDYRPVQIELKILIRLPGSTKTGISTDSNYLLWSEKSLASQQTIERKFSIYDRPFYF